MNAVLGRNSKRQSSSFVHVCICTTISGYIPVQKLKYDASTASRVTQQLNKHNGNVASSCSFQLSSFSSHLQSESNPADIFVVPQVPAPGPRPAAAVAEEHGPWQLDSFSTPVYLPPTFWAFVLQGALGDPLPGEWRGADGLPGAWGGTETTPSSLLVRYTFDLEQTRQTPRPRARSGPPLHLVWPTRPYGEKKHLFTNNHVILWNFPFF